MKRWMRLALVLLAIPAMAQFNTKVHYVMTYNPPAPIPVACSTTVTASCLAGFEMRRLATPTAAPDLVNDLVVLAASPLLNADGTINTSVSAQVSAVTIDQPMGRQAYYVITVAKDQSGGRIVSVPVVAPAVVISPFPGSGLSTPSS